MGLLGTALKWKFGRGKKDFPVLLHLRNGKCCFFSKRLDKTDCIQYMNSNGEVRKIPIKDIYDRNDNSIVPPYSTFLENGMPLIQLVEGASGNIKAVDIVDGVKPSLEDRELNDLNESYLHLGQALERKKNQGMLFGDKANIGIGIIILLAVAFVAYTTMMNSSLLTQLIDEGVKCGARVVAGG